MDIFLYTIIILLGLTVLGKVKSIADDEYLERTRKTETWDVFCNSAIVVWAIILLAI